MVHSDRGTAVSRGTDVRRGRAAGHRRTDFVTYGALASQLYTETLNVRSLTGGISPGNHEYHLLESAVERLYQTCVACHKLFRDAGPAPEPAPP
jgi:hypothetical protein